MGGEWRQGTVEDIAAGSRNALVGGPFGSNLVSRDYVETGVPVIRGQNMGLRWVGGEFAYVSDEKSQSLLSNLARPNDIVFTQRGTIGQVSLVPKYPYECYLISQSQMKLTVNPDIADPIFYYYVFCSREKKNYIKQNAIQTGVPHINLGILRFTPIPLPPLSEQRAIAHILGSLDDKIELNRQVNRTLEQMAQALFKSWFIDFDPVVYNAVQAGHPVPERFQATAERYRQNPEVQTLPQHILDLFPDRFEESELGEIPVGWRVRAVGDVIELAYGKSLPLKSRIAGPIPVYGSGGVTGWHSESMVAGPGIVIGRKGTVGSVYWVEGDFFPIDTVFYVKVRESISLHWLFLNLSKMDIKSLGADSAVPGVNRNSILAQKWIMPNDDVLKEYQSICDNYLSQIYVNEEQVTILSDVRDNWLPNLISGENRILDSEKVLEQEV